MQMLSRAGTEFIASAVTTCNFTNIIKNNLSFIYQSYYYIRMFVLSLRIVAWGMTNTLNSKDYEMN